MDLSRQSFAGRAAMTEQLTITLGQWSCVGAKPENQDFHGVLHGSGDDLVTKGIAIALADGISTSRLGAAAAETAVKSFLTDYFCTSPAWSVAHSGQKVIAATNSWMHAQNQRQGPLTDETREAGLVCTLSALVLKSRHAHVFHVGDAQLARIAGDSLDVLTQPHRVSLGGGETYLGRALGVNRHVEIDYRQVPVQPGDLFLLTTDGVHDVLPSARIVAIVQKAHSLDEAARALCEAAEVAGSGDNLTAQLVRIETLPAGDVADLIGDGATLPPAPHLTAGETFEGWHVLRQLYAGARSRAYLVRDVETGERAVLKVPSTEHGQNAQELAALLLEEWVMRRVSHQNLLAPAGAQRRRGHVYAVAAYVEGQTLDEWMHDNPRPELGKVRDIVRQIASGLLALHRKQMIHRDLRPQNVMIDAEGTVTIIDFGSVEVAGLEEAAPGAAKQAVYAGTVQYSAPEIYRGEAATEQSDLYSLGAIAYQLLTGDLPYGPRVANATTLAAQKRLHFTPVRERNDDVPAWMDAAIARACAIDPARRYAELSEFTFDLAHPNPALTAEVQPLLKRGTVRHWRAATLILAALLALSILTRPDIGPPPSPQSKETAR